MHEGHCRAGGYLRLLEFGIGLTAIDTMEKKLNDPGTDKAERKTKEGGENQTIKNAISAWLSLVGIPNFHATVAQSTMAKRAAHRAIVASPVLVPKSTML